MSDQGPLHLSVGLYRNAFRGHRYFFLFFPSIAISVSASVPDPHNFIDQLSSWTAKDGPPGPAGAVPQIPLLHTIALPNAPSGRQQESAHTTTLQ
jgi:hypothetical protein